MTDKNAVPPRYCAYGRDDGVTAPRGAPVCYGLAEHYQRRGAPGLCDRHKHLVGSKEEVILRVLREVFEAIEPYEDTRYAQSVVDDLINDITNRSGIPGRRSNGPGR